MDEAAEDDCCCCCGFLTGPETGQAGQDGVGVRVVSIVAVVCLVELRLYVAAGWDRHQGSLGRHW